MQPYLRSTSSETVEQEGVAESSRLVFRSSRFESLTTSGYPELSFRGFSAVFCVMLPAQYLATYHDCFQIVALVNSGSFCVGFVN